MRIHLGCDHRGYELKEKIKSYLSSLGYEVCDHGTHSSDSVDYPDFVAEAVKHAVELGERAIVMCGSGLGASMSANKVRGARAALVTRYEQAVSSREHNDANVLVLAADFTTFYEARMWISVWLETPFSGEERHRRRISKLHKLEVADVQR